MTKVALVKGESRRSNILKALRLMEDEINESISSKDSDTLFIKVNAIDSNYPLACTHPDALEAVLEFFHGKFKKVIVGDNTFVFSKKSENLYTSLRSKFKGIEFSDLTEYKTKKIIFKLTNTRKVNAEASLLPEEAYTISLALPKTHDTFIYTGCAKNMLGCVVSGRSAVHGLGTHERLFLNLIVRSNPIKNENILEMLSNVKSDLSVLDGFVAMEGDGPVTGTEVRLGIAACGFDAIAVDSLACDIMGLDKVPYLEMCGEQGIGTTDKEKIKILKHGFDDLDDIRIEVRSHYLTKYLIATAGVRRWLPMVDLKFAAFLLKRSYRIKEKIKGWVRKKRYKF